MYDAVQNRPVARAAAKAAVWGRVEPEPYARMELSPAARAGLFWLRAFLCLITAMAVFAFFRGLQPG